MNMEKHLGGLAELLGVPLYTVERERMEVLAAIRAGAEFARTLPEGEPTHRVKHTLAAWITTVAPTSGAKAQAVLDGARPTLDTTWLREVFAERLAGETDLPLRFLMALLVLLPPGYSHLRRSHDYMMAAAEALVWSEEVPRILAWVERSGDGEQMGALDEVAAAWAGPDTILGAYMRASLEAHAAWRAEADRRDDAGQFGHLRIRLLRVLETLEEPAKDLGIALQPMRDLRRYAEADSFRVAVLGEFKRGKSTLVNLLLGIDGLMPVDELPCTSTVTSIRYGDGFAFERQAANGAWEPRTAQDFQRAVAQARRASVVGTAEEVPHWRVTAPSALLRTGFLEIVDTPGLGEDEARDRLALREAHRTDGAILVLSAEQQVTMKEAELARELRHRQENLLVIINKADLSQLSARRLVEYVHDRLEDRGVKLPSDRLVPFSAALARVGAGAARPDLISADHLTAVVREKILTRSVARKRRVMAGKILETLQLLKPNIETTLVRRRRNLEEHEQVSARRAEALALAQGAVEGVRRARQIIEESAEPTLELTRALYEALPGIIETTRSHESEWTSSFMPLTSPKKHAEEVASKARTRFLRVLEEWLKGEGAAVVTRAVVAKLDRAATELAPLRHYLQATLGLSEEEASARIATLEEQSLRDSVDLPVETGDAVGVALRVALMTVVTLIVGYVIADVILYYLLSVISGFLNPILLAAAVVAAIVAYLVKGDDWVRSSIRNKLLDKIAEELQKPEVREKIQSAIERGLVEFFRGLATSFDQKTRELLDDVAYQTRRIEEEAERLVKANGDPAWIRAEIDRLTSVADQVRQGVEELERLLKDIHAVPEGSPTLVTRTEHGGTS